MIAGVRINVYKRHMISKKHIVIRTIKFNEVED